jgi:hypothetical protein
MAQAQFTGRRGPGTGAEVGKDRTGPDLDERPLLFSMSPNQAIPAEKSIRFSPLVAAQPLTILSWQEALNASGSRRACRMAMRRNDRPCMFDSPKQLRMVSPKLVRTADSRRACPMAISRNACSLLALSDFPEFTQAVRNGVHGTPARYGVHGTPASLQRLCPPRCWPARPGPRTPRLPQTDCRSRQSSFPNRREQTSYLERFHGKTCLLPQSANWSR